MKLDNLPEIFIYQLKDFLDLKGILKLSYLSLKFRTLIDKKSVISSFNINSEQRLDFIRKYFSVNSLKLTFLPNQIEYDINYLNLSKCLNLNLLNYQSNNVISLNLSGCSYITLLDLLNFPNLEELNLMGLFKIKNFNGILQLKKLKKLNLSYCIELTDSILNSILSSLQLIELNIENCYQITDEAFNQKHYSLDYINLNHLNKITEVTLNKFDKYDYVNSYKYITHFIVSVHVWGATGPVGAKGAVGIMGPVGAKGAVRIMGPVRIMGISPIIKDDYLENTHLKNFKTYKDNIKFKYYGELKTQIPCPNDRYDENLSIEANNIIYSCHIIAIQNIKKMFEEL